MRRLVDLLARPEPVAWLFIGDSITHGAHHTMGWRDYTELFRERVVWERKRKLDLVVNTAFSGYTTRGLLAEYGPRVERIRADVVFIMIGMNDCAGRKVPLDEFEANLRVLAARIRKGGTLPVLQTTCPVVAGKAPGRQENLPDYMDAVRRVAVEEELPLADHAAEWETFGEQRRHYLMSDPFHPNEYGHRAFAHRLFKEMGLWETESAVCRQFVP